MIKYWAGLCIALLAVFFAPAASAAPPPVITSISPTNGNAGDSVVITGTDLWPFSTVKFGSTATTYTNSSSTSLTAVVPSGTGTVPVTVTTPNGTSNAVNFAYGYTPPTGSKTIVGPGTSVQTGGGPLAGGSWCTMGSVGRDDLGNLVGIIAGHCNTEKGQDQPLKLADTVNGPGMQIGVFKTSTTYPEGEAQLPVDSSLDYAVVLLDENVVQPSVTTPTGHVIDKVYTGPIYAGLGMAHYGQVSGWAAGSVSAYEDNVIYSGNLPNIPGDSGGPVRIGGNGALTCGVGCGFAGVNSAINPLPGSLGAFQFTGIAGILADIAAQGPSTIGIGFEPSAT